MIIKKTWKTHYGNFAYKYEYTGWFLFGIIPLYITRKSNY